ncbi:MAG: DnaJ domain-containing protein [Verrucomicrobia bacterium]|nr:DnaJ domain-containing protein [Verrucomicrobiota bacterium]MBI3867157.1 DnaJ domain-containing protein [Verrucomicrobiota bacterium]
MITDCFALLDEPRRPGIDLHSLKSRFMRLSASLHPDRFHQAAPEEREAASDRFTSLNAAYQTLADPKERLRHLYELETGGPPSDIQKIPPGTMDLFMEVGQSCRDVDAILTQPSEGLSPLVKVQRIRAAREWVGRLQTLQSAVSGKREEWLAEMDAANAAWIAVANAVTTDDRRRRLPLDRLVEIYRGLSYVGRWTEQLQQRIAELVGIG